MATISTGVFRYTSLPAEIRNAIMEYALVPGDVYSCSKQAKPTSTNPSRKLLQAIFKRPTASLKTKTITIDHQTPMNQPAFHLLTTSKSAYQDGHYNFYTKNTFHLPPGSVHDARIWLNSLKPYHKSLIKNLCITFSLADLAPHVLTEMEKKWLWDFPASTPQDEQRIVNEVSYILCWRYWQDRIRWLREWEGLEKVGLRMEDGRMVDFGGGAFREMDAKVEKGLLEGAREVVRVRLEGLVREVGWKGVRRWLLGRGVI